MCVQSRNNRGSVLKGLKRLRGRISFDVPMNRHTTMRVGGAALALYQPQALADLIEAVRFCKSNNISFLAVGSGSNIIVNDKGTKNLIIKLSSPFFKRTEVFGTEISCGAGVLLRELCHAAETHSLGGAEFLVGIPGTVGGAVIQNAGAYGSSVADIIKDVKALDRNRRVVTLKKDDINFGYRTSSLDHLIILGATFRLFKKSKDVIKNTVSRYIEKRLSSQDYTAPSAGCIFKNPKGHSVSAGELIDRCGLRGRTIGGASISEIHANFIINKKQATADDILRLIAIVKDEVQRRFSIRLEEEVKIIE